MIDLLVNVFRIAAIVVGLGLIIFIHELGHFLMAKKNGVRVEAFSLGFGPVLWKRRRGDTEYRISAIPLGGYVKMAGELPGEETTGEPYELTSKSVWARFQIFVAGAVMNILLAFPLCILSFWLGQWVLNPEAGSISQPEMEAEMMPGDRLLEVDGSRVETAEEYRMIMAGKATGSFVPVKVERDGEIKILKVKQCGARAHHVLPRSTVVTEVAEESLAEKAGFREGDVFFAIEGRPVFTREEVESVLGKNFGKPLRITVRRLDPETEEWNRVDLVLEVPATHGFPVDEHLIEAVVGEVIAGRPADGKLKKGDRILRAGDVRIRSFRDLKDVVGKSGGKALQLEVERGGEKISVELTPVEIGPGRALLGIRNLETDRIAHVVEGEYYDLAGLKAGDELIEVGSPGQEFKVSDIFWSRRKELPVTVFREGKSVSLRLPAKPEFKGDVLGLGFETGENPQTGREELVLALDRVFRRWSLGEAIVKGIKEPLVITDLTYRLLKKIFTADESASDLAGPVGIAHVSYQMTTLGPGKFIWLLALITVNLGIFNLLPIPVLDGGHVVLLVIEKIRGRRPSERFIERFQYVGLFFLLALIVFVTYNDILRAVGAS